MKKIRIGVLTFHRCINYGAFMQCYSLINRLKQDFPQAHVEVIDYSQKRLLFNYTTDRKEYLCGSQDYPYTWKQRMVHLLLYLRNPKSLRELEKLKQAFARNRSCLPLSEYRIVSDSEEELLKEIEGRYDIVIVGSDCVWEFLTYAFPNPYFLNRDLGAEKFSYAASSDRMYFPNITKEQIRYIDQAMSDMRYLGVRDCATENFLHSINPNLNLHHNCDPTLFLDLEHIPVKMSRLKEKLISRGVDLTKPVIGVMGDDNIGNLVWDLFHGQYQVVALYTRIKKCDCFLEGLTPFEWSRIFSFFSITFTRYFHGTILSLKNGVPTITLDPWKMEDEKHKTKIKDLYDRLGLEGHYYRKKKFYSKREKQEIAKYAIKFMNKPDKRKIQKAIEKEAESYQDFYKELQKVIEDGQKDK